MNHWYQWYLSWHALSKHTSEAFGVQGLLMEVPKFHGAEVLTNAPLFHASGMAEYCSLPGSASKPQIKDNTN